MSARIRRAGCNLTPSLALNHWTCEEISPVWEQTEAKEAPKGPPSSCPYKDLPKIAQLAFVDLKRTTGAPDVVVFGWILAAMTAVAMRKIKVKAPGMDVDVVSLFFIIASPSGTAKSPVYRQVSKPFVAHDARVSRENKKAAADRDPEMEVWATELDSMKRLLAKLTNRLDAIGSEELAALKNAIKEHVRRKPQSSQTHRLVQTKATMVRILELLDGDSRSLFLATDDGLKFLAKVIKEDQDDFERLFDGSMIFEGKKNQDYAITNPLVTLSLTTQTSLLIKFLEKSSEDLIEGGLLPRCLTAVDYDEEEGDEEPDDDHGSGAVDAFNAFNAKILEETTPDDGQKVPEQQIVEFDWRSGNVFKEFKSLLRDLRKRGQPLHDVKAFSRKAPRLVSRMAAIFALYDEKAELEVSEDTLYRAINVVAWYIGHAKWLFVDRLSQNNRQEVIDLLTECFADRCHLRNPKPGQPDNPLYVPKAYIQQRLHMKVSTLNPVLHSLEKEKIAWRRKGNREITCVQLNSAYFAKLANQH
jgi:hypothetical protein